MYICVYTCLYICIYVHIHIYIYIHSHIHIPYKMYVPIHVHMHIYNIHTPPLLLPFLPSVLLFDNHTHLIFFILPIQPPAQTSSRVSLDSQHMTAVNSKLPFSGAKTPQ